MPLTPDALAAALKRPLPPLAVVAGEEALLVMEAADAVRAAAKAQGFDEREVFEVDKSGGWGDVLGAANSYAGGTTISAGTLQGDVDSLGSGAITNNASLALDQADAGRSRCASRARWASKAPRP